MEPSSVKGVGPVCIKQLLHHNKQELRQVTNLEYLPTSSAMVLPASFAQDVPEGFCRGLLSDLGRRGSAIAAVEAIERFGFLVRTVPSRDARERMISERDQILRDTPPAWLVCADRVFRRNRVPMERGGYEGPRGGPTAAPLVLVLALVVAVGTSWYLVQKVKGHRKPFHDDAGWRDAL